MSRKTDARVQDPLVLDEIELYGDLVIAASASEEPLSQDEIDVVLGLPKESPEGNIDVVLGMPKESSERS